MQLVDREVWGWKWCNGDVVFWTGGTAYVILRARVKNNLWCALPRAPCPIPTYTYLFCVDICAASYFVFSIEDLQVDFFSNVYYRGTFRGKPVSLLGLRWVWFIQYIHKRAAIQQVGGQAPAVERFKRGHFHHTILPCSLFSIRSIFCLQCFFGEKDALAGRLFMTN